MPSGFRTDKRVRRSQAAFLCYPYIASWSAIQDRNRILYVDGTMFLAAILMKDPRPLGLADILNSSSSYKPQPKFFWRRRLLILQHDYGHYSCLRISCLMSMKLSKKQVDKAAPEDSCLMP